MSERTRTRLVWAAVAAILSVVPLAGVGALDVDDQNAVDLSIGAAVYPSSSADPFVTDSTVVAPPTVEHTASSTTTTAPQLSDGPVGSVTPDTASQTRLAAIPGSTLPLPTTTTIPTPIDGDCESWRPLLERYRIPYDEALPYMRRESRCSMAWNGDASTEDDSWGPLQANRYGRLAAWWDSGGYTLAVMQTPEGSVAAAAVLYHSCGWGPWHRSEGYPCYGDWLETPEPRWGEW